MENSKLIRKLIKKIRSDEVVMLHLIGSYGNPVGYVWGSAVCPAAIFHTSGRADCDKDDFFRKTLAEGVDISEGTYLGKTIESYEVLKRNAVKSEESE